MFPADLRGGDDSVPRDWYVHGTFMGGQLRNKAGVYYVVLTTNGRTSDGCDSHSLGDVVIGDMSPDNPFRQVSGGVGVGVLPDQLRMGSQGPTVYSSKLEGVSR